MIVSHKHQSKRMLSFNAIYDYVCNKLVSVSTGGQDDSFPTIETTRQDLDTIVFKDLCEWHAKIRGVIETCKKQEILVIRENMIKTNELMEKRCLEKMKEYVQLTDEQRVRYEELMEKYSQ
jgi:hypothetical protein